MITYDIEDYTDELYEELMVVLHKHYKEVEPYADKIPLNPHPDYYRTLADLDSLALIIARDGERIIGYSAFTITPHPHSKDHILAINDFIYVIPDYRHTEVFPELLKVTDEYLKSVDVSISTYNFKKHIPCEDIMDHMGYKQVEVVYMKLMDE